ncbi:MAG: ROK family protein [Oscillospiraceae bacterium]|nr:ROK family protein [Oscillospiraceae bacterium]MCD8256889.1 ROK family protein [Oscillospiraceae bacterium]
MAYYIGIDLGGSHFSVGIVDAQWRIIGEAAAPSAPERGAAAVAADMAAHILRALDAAGLSLSDCCAVGIGSPGTCDSATGVVLQAHNLGWYRVPLCALLQAELGVPAFLANDGDCAALGEVCAGAAQGSENALLVALGTGVGGGVILGGKICSGHRALGGELGHICIQMGGAECTCGARGCWEAYASAAALVRQAEVAAAEEPASALCAVGTLDGRKIFDAARAGDRTAVAVLARWYQYIGVGLVNLTNVLFPEVILLGGGVSAQGETLLAPVRAYVASHIFVRDCAQPPRIECAALANRAGVIGSAAFAAGCL